MSNIKHRLEGEGSLCAECVAKKTSGARAPLTLVDGLTVPLSDVLLDRAAVVVGSTCAGRLRLGVSMSEFGNVDGCYRAARIAAGGMV